MATASRLIPVQVGDILIEVDAFPVSGVEPTVSCVRNAAESVLEAFYRVEDAIVAAAKSSARRAASSADDPNAVIAPTRGETFAPLGVANSQAQPARSLHRTSSPRGSLRNVQGQHVQE
jgi:hypothetical protein